MKSIESKSTCWKIKLRNLFSTGFAVNFLSIYVVLPLNSDFSEAGEVDRDKVKLKARSELRQGSRLLNAPHLPPPHPPPPPLSEDTVSRTTGRMLVKQLQVLLEASSEVFAGAAVP